nr:unnamed protein product [Haemonchus contortus]
MRMSCAVQDVDRHPNSLGSEISTFGTDKTIFTKKLSASLSGKIDTYRIAETVNFFRQLRREAIRAGIGRLWKCIELQGEIDLVRPLCREAIRMLIRSRYGLHRSQIILFFCFTFFKLLD